MQPAVFTGSYHFLSLLTEIELHDPKFVKQFHISSGSAIAVLSHIIISAIALVCFSACSSYRMFPNVNDHNLPSNFKCGKQTPLTLSFTPFFPTLLETYHFFFLNTFFFAYSQTFNTSVFFHTQTPALNLFLVLKCSSLHNSSYRKGASKRW